MNEFMHRVLIEFKINSSLELHVCAYYFTQCTLHFNFMYLF